MPRRTLLLAALVGPLAACGVDGGAVPPDPVESAAVRTDRDPIATRFPRLGAFTGVHWVGGRLGDDRVPGPSLYFVEAVVTLADGDAQRLAAEYALAPTADVPDAPASLAPYLDGDGPWSASEALDQGFGPAQWFCGVLVRLADGVVHVSARGE